MKLVGGPDGIVQREGQVGGTNGCSKRASEEKQIFALDLGHIPGIQMTFPPVSLLVALMILSPKEKNICWGLWNSGGHQSL